MANARLGDLTTLISLLRYVARQHALAGDRRDPSVIEEEVMAEIRVPNLARPIAKLEAEGWPHMPLKAAK